MPDRRRTSQNCLGEIRFSEDPPQTRITLHESKSTTMIFEAETDACHPSDTLTDDGEARNDFLDDRWELHLSVICAERRIIPESTAIFLTWVRITNAILDVLLESRIDDSWNVDGHLLWSSFTQFTKNISRRIHVVPKADKNSSNIKARLFMARDLVRNGEGKISSRLLKN